MGKVGTVILVDGETEPALKRANVILEEIRIFLKIDRFKSQFTEALSSIGVGARVGGNTSAAKFASSTVLDGLVS